MTLYCTMTISNLIAYSEQWIYLIFFSILFLIWIVMKNSVNEWTAADGLIGRIGTNTMLLTTI